MSKLKVGDICRASGNFADSDGWGLPVTEGSIVEIVLDLREFGGVFGGVKYPWRCRLLIGERTTATKSLDFAEAELEKINEQESD